MLCFGESILYPCALWVNNVLQLANQSERCRGIHADVFVRIFLNCIWLSTYRRVNVRSKRLQAAIELMNLIIW